MRAVVCRKLGGIEALAVEDVPPPPLPDRAVRIAVRAAGLNFADALLVAGKYQTKLEPPFTPGFEVSGEVLEVAPGVTTCRPGDRVMAALDAGGFAEEAVARADDVHVLPAGMAWDVAASFPIAYGTSHFGLRYRAALAPGETLLVHGAGSGVGLTAVEVGRALGATVIAAASGDEKRAVAVAHGAHHTVDARGDDLRERVRALTGGRGADVVYDPVGGAAFDASLRCTAPDGRILVVGFASGTVPQVPANVLLVKNLTVVGYAWPAYRSLAPARVRASFDELLGWWAEGKVRPRVSTALPLARAVEAMALLRDRKVTGKAVLTVGDAATPA